MGKLLFWAVILAVAFLAWRWHVGSSGRGSERGSRRERDEADSSGEGRDPGSEAGRGGQLPPPESMMQCKVCGVHLPGSEAVFARGRVYCSSEHRESDGR
jgi:uncharacterized protein